MGASPILAAGFLFCIAAAQPEPAPPAGTPVHRFTTGFKEVKPGRSPWVNFVRTPLAAGDTFDYTLTMRIVPTNKHKTEKLTPWPPAKVDLRVTVVEYTPTGVVFDLRFLDVEVAPDRRIPAAELERYRVDLAGTLVTEAERMSFGFLFDGLIGPQEMPPAAARLALPMVLLVGTPQRELGDDAMWITDGRFFGDPQGEGVARLSRAGRQFIVRETLQARERDAAGREERGVEAKREMRFTAGSIMVDWAEGEFVREVRRGGAIEQEKIAVEIRRKPMRGAKPAR